VEIKGSVQGNKREQKETAQASKGKEGQKIAHVEINGSSKMKNAEARREKKKKRDRKGKALVIQWLFEKKIINAGDWRALTD
jgi:hypothetical protein